MSEAAVSPKIAKYVAKWHARGQKRVTPVQGQELRYLTMEGASPKHLGDKLKLATATVNTAIKRVGPGPALISTSKLFQELVASEEIWQAVGWDRVLHGLVAQLVRASSPDSGRSLVRSQTSDGNQTNSEDWEAEEALLNNRPPWKVAYNTGGAKTLQDVLEATAPPLIARLDDIMGCGPLGSLRLARGKGGSEQLDTGGWQARAVARGGPRPRGAGITQRSDLVQLGWMGEEWLVGLISMLLPERELFLVVLHICEKILEEVKEVWDVWCAMPAAEHADYFVYE
ncbi:uncharacterized protein SCHCODRAFT_02732883 [Schizophyllum commune H4-8]|uniref:uncharacterized protein n=1 Tax=Schizophyllum commune (strain H4-8 / FGSC 9210) TaxID=578458 RepID=UPI00215FE419|nr:uncharacterized protein SCHCODRAFT_02732883 [Schizophyllum commune H4-8]KAI5892340.1 hypothetical protein SCHCODRAFT_02732883 [Schizophyllum commune H4-8]